MYDYPDPEKRGAAMAPDASSRPVPELLSKSEDLDDDLLPQAVEEQRRRKGSLSDAVFGEITEKGPNYRNVGWIGAIVVMLKIQIGLGVLSIPVVFNTLGMVPGVIILVTIAAITTWSGVIVGQFKLAHPEVYSIDDAAGLMFGPVGRWSLGIAFVLYWIFVSGSGMLGISIALNALSSHGTCTAVFVAVAAIAAFCLASIRTLGKISWLAYIGLTGILASIFTLTVAVGLQDRPSAAPQTGPWRSDYKIVTDAKFSDAVSAVSSIIFAYSGTSGFFSVISEMREPRLYTRSLIASQAIITLVYLAIGIVVYYFCGSYVATPALGSAGHVLKKVCYGLALPGLLVTTTLVSHIPAKYIFVHALRGTRHLNSNTWVHWVSWFSCTFGVIVIAYVIASAIPVFGGLVSLIGALLGTFMCITPMGFMWMYDHWHEGKSDARWRWYLMVGFSCFVIAVGCFLTVAGTYGSVVGIIDSYRADGGSAAWSCADNSNSS